jgi:hypothetical protein
MAAQNLRIHRLLRDLMAKQNFYKCSRLKHFLIQVNPACSPKPYFFMVYLSTYYTPRPRPSGLFPSGLSIQFYVLCALSTSWFHRLKRIWWRVKVMNLNIVQFCQESSYFLSPRYKYSRQCSFLRHPASTFFSYCDRRYFTATQNNGQHSSFVCFNLHVSGWQKGRKIWP